MAKMRGSLSQACPSFAIRRFRRCVERGAVVVELSHVSGPMLLGALRRAQCTVPVQVHAWHQFDVQFAETLAPETRDFVCASDDALDRVLGAEFNVVPTDVLAMQESVPVAVIVTEPFERVVDSPLKLLRLDGYPVVSSQRTRRNCRCQSHTKKHVSHFHDTETKYQISELV